MVEWIAIEPKGKEYDTVIGYTLTVRNSTYINRVNTSEKSSSFRINNLSHNTNYCVSVVGRSVEGEGMPSGWLCFKTASKYLTLIYSA